MADNRNKSLIEKVLPSDGPTWQTTLSAVLAILSLIAMLVGRDLLQDRRDLRDKVNDNSSRIVRLETNLDYMREGIDDIKVMVRELTNESK